MKKYRKKPVVIEAVQYMGNNEKEILKWVNDEQASEGDNCILIASLEGVMMASVGDYIIKGVEDEFYPCKPGIFEKTYEEI